VVVGQPGGSLGRHGAVVTFPFRAPPRGDDGTLVDIGGVTGVASGGAVTWSLAGGYARVRGDLSEAELVAVAAGTSIVGGQPVVRPPAWEPAPGVVTYVGYSSSSVTPSAAAALERLARRGRLLTAAEWRAIRAQLIEEVDGFD
jgi:hypothetical protein